MKTPPKFTALSAASLLLFAASSANGAITLVSHDFGGLSSTDLSGQTADAFAAAITTAGGSSTWTGGDRFKADGSVADTGSGTRQSASLNLGSFINGQRGNSDAIFILSVTMAQPTGSNWISSGLSTLNTPSTGHDMTGSSNTGAVTTYLYRIGASAQLDMRDGLGTDGVIVGSNGVSTAGGVQTLTVTLDLRNWNGTDNWGTVTYTATGFTTPESYTSNLAATNSSFGAILLTTAPSAAGSISNVTLSQIPEPTTALLGGLGLLALLRRRR